MKTLIQMKKTLLTRLILMIFAVCLLAIGILNYVCVKMKDSEYGGGYGNGASTWQFHFQFLP